MEPEHRAVLRKFRVPLSDQLLVSDSIVPFLYQQEVLTAAQVEQLEAERTERRRNLKLLDLLPSRGPRAFGAFMEALRDFGWIRDRLQLELQNPAGTGPNPAGTGPPGPNPAGTGPNPAGTGPNPAGTGPNPDGTGPNPAGTGPPGPNPAGTGPPGPNPAGTGPNPDGTGLSGGAAVTARYHGDASRIPDSVLQRVPSDRELTRLAQRLGAEWEPVLLDLGLSVDAVYRCRSDHSRNTGAAVLDGLVLWRRGGGRRATLGRLLRSLEAADLHPSVLDEAVLG